jgi:TonB family protein
VSAAAGVSVLCPGYVEAIQSVDYPPQALEAGLGRGDVLLELNLDQDGRVHGVRVLQASDRIFARAAIEAAKRLQCQGTGVSQRVSLPIVYRPPQGP